ncbi:hypothetical protein HDV05_002849 [Chytridiales sp. JEL 0842]|nr:hypothetical protein HDV05_002849 [Chytridiales sp. JEL 0842]
MQLPSYFFVHQKGLSLKENMKFGNKASMFANILSLFIALVLSYLLHVSNDLNKVLDISTGSIDLSSTVGAILYIGLVFPLLKIFILKLYNLSPAFKMTDLRTKEEYVLAIRKKMKLTFSYACYIGAMEFFILYRTPTFSSFVISLVVTRLIDVMKRMHSHYQFFKTLKTNEEKRVEPSSVESVDGNGKEAFISANNAGSHSPYVSMKTAVISSDEQIQTPQGLRGEGENDTAPRRLSEVKVKGVNPALMTISESDGASDSESVPTTVDVTRPVLLSKHSDLPPIPSADSLPTYTLKVEDPTVATHDEEKRHTTLDMSSDDSPPHLSNTYEDKGTVEIKTTKATPTHTHSQLQLHASTALSAGHHKPHHEFDSAAGSVSSLAPLPTMGKQVSKLSFSRSTQNGDRPESIVGRVSRNSVAKRTLATIKRRISDPSKLQSHIGPKLAYTIELWSSILGEFASATMGAVMAFFLGFDKSYTHCNGYLSALEILYRLIFVLCLLFILQLIILCGEEAFFGFELSHVVLHLEKFRFGARTYMCFTFMMCGSFAHYVMVEVWNRVKPMMRSTKNNSSGSKDKDKDDEKRQSRHHQHGSSASRSSSSHSSASDDDSDSSMSDVDPSPSSTSNKTRQPAAQDPPAPPPVPNWSRHLTLVPTPSLQGDRIRLSQDALESLLQASSAGNSLPSLLIFEILNTKTNVKVYGTVREFTARDPSTVEVGVAMAESLGLQSDKIPKSSISATSSSSSSGHTPSEVEDMIVDDSIQPTTTHEQDDSQVRVKLVSLPKASYLKIAPLDPDYLQIPDLRPLLESHLRQNYAVISQGETLVVPTHLSKPFHRFLITNVQPAPACVCIDVDVNLEVVPLDMDLAEEAVRRKLNLPSLSASSATPSGVMGDEVLEVPLIQESQSQGKGKAPATLADIQDQKLVGVYKGVVPSSHGWAYFKVRHSKDVTNYVIQLEPTGPNPEADADVFVSLNVERPTEMDHHFANVDYGLSKVHFSMAEAVERKMEVPYIYIAVKNANSNNAPTAFTLTICPTSEAPPPLFNPLETPQSPTPPPPTHTICPNCSAPVPKTTLVMHEAFCRRNNIVCTQCKAANRSTFVFQKSSMEEHWHCPSCPYIADDLASKTKHLDAVHTPHSCTCDPSVSLPLHDLALHRRTSCPTRLILCRYCHLTLPAGPPSTLPQDLLIDPHMGTHESQCGSRTIQCTQCTHYIPLKNIPTHALLHQHQKQSQPPPPLCTNTPCSRFRDPKFPNSMHLCSACYKPFWSPRYDEGDKKLVEKMVGVYHSQLMRGCGLSFCKNQECKTGKGGEGVEMDSTGAAVRAVGLVKRSAVFQKDVREVMYAFCVKEEKVAKRRQAAEELKHLGFRVEWCVKALEVCADKTEDAVNWLLREAPKAK